MYRVKDPVFAMAESSLLDGGSRLDDVEARFQMNRIEHQAAIQSIAAPCGSVHATGAPFTDSRNRPAFPAPA